MTCIAAHRLYPILGCLLMVACTTWTVTPYTGSGCVVALSKGRVQGALGNAVVEVLLDTGVDHVAVTRSCAERLDLEADDGLGLATYTDSTGAEADGLRLTRLSCLQIGSVEFPSVPAIILPDSVVPVDVVVGMPLLRAACWLFDEAGGLLRVLPANSGESDLASLGYSVVCKVPLSGGGRPTVPVRLNNDPTPHILFIDSGSSRTAIPSEVVESLALPAADTYRVTSSSPAVMLNGQRPGYRTYTGLLGRSIERSSHRLEKLEFGAVSVADLTVSSYDARGLLGMDVLAVSPWLLCGQRAEIWQLDTVQPRAR